MKEEIEFKWIVNLYNSENLSKSLFGKRGGTLREFEKYANAPFNSKEFKKWFKEMLETKVIKFSEHRENPQGRPTKVYILDKDNMFKYLKNFSFYKRFRKIVHTKDI